MTRYLGHLTCPRCGDRAEEWGALHGCPRCRDEGVGSNFLADYSTPSTPPVSDPSQPGIFRWRTHLPIADATEPVSLDEGDTPLVAVAALASRWGTEQAWVKDESRNPTWSYKDRLAAVAVTKARELGTDTVVVSTTGNHGAAVAAYAARAGLRCVVLTLASVPETMRTLMQSYGAIVVALGESTERWTLMAQAVDRLGWVPMSNFCDPPVGSIPFGVDGYKTIAFEIQRDLGDAPTHVIVPTAYADGLTGMWRGFRDLHDAGVTSRLPTMIAAEPLGPYGANLDAGTDGSTRVAVRPSVAFSTASPVATYQGLHTLRESGGRAFAQPDDEKVIADQTWLARASGLYLEAASAVGVSAGDQMSFGADARVVLVGSSTGLKDPMSTALRLPPVPTIAPDLAELISVVERS